jgi:ATP-dependent RNA helicase DeaD
METEEITFEDLGLDEKTLAAVARKGFVTPSPIQILAIPRLLDGDANVIAKARTGTGKTAAFGLPLVQKLCDKKDYVRALVLEPTRELAVQTCNELQSFTTGTFPKTTVVYGGASMGEQIRELRRGTDIVVGTPGRIQDHLKRGTLSIEKIDYFILDEGDEMLDMGFVDDIEAIFGQANPDSRILLFSATMPAPILKIAQKFMGDYEIVEEEEVAEEPLLIKQTYWVVREREKIEALVRLIDISPDFYGLVFTQTKADADMLSRLLDERGYEVAALHGDIPQGQREKILSRFRSRKTRILVATDVAARGIDITGLSHVVNYSLPFDVSTYIHRIGRTGRAGAAGCAVTFVRPEERRKLGYLRSAVQRASKGELAEEQVPSVETVLKEKRRRMFTDMKKSIGLMQEDAGTEDVMGTADDAAISGNPVAAADAAAAITAAENSPVNDTEDVDSGEMFTSSNDTAMPGIIQPQPVFTEMAEKLCDGQDAVDILAAVLSVTYGKSLDKSHYGKISSAGGESSNSRRQIRLYVQLGRRDGYNPRRIADYFSDLLDIPGRMVDQIDVASNFSLVSLPSSAGTRALDLSRKNKSVAHMHIDSKSADFVPRDNDPGRSGRSRNSRRYTDYNEAESNFSRGKRKYERGDSGFKAGGRKSYHTRPNVHTPTHRSGNAGLYRRKYSESGE